MAKSKHAFKAQNISEIDEHIRDTVPAPAIECDPYKNMAYLVASRLNREELIELAELLDGDANHDFCMWIQERCCDVAPELF